jgi:hypothetical protein
VHYTLRVEENCQCGLDAGPLEFQFCRPTGCLSNPFRTLLLCFRVIGKTPGLISCNNFVKKILVCIAHRDNILARCDSIFPLLRCQGVRNKMCTKPLSQILFQNLKNYSLGDVQRFCYHSCCNLMVILTKSATAAMSTSVWVNFGWPPLSSSSTSSLLSRNQKYHLKHLIGSEPYSHKPFAPILMFLSQIDWLWNKILWQLYVHFCHLWCIKKTDFTRQVITCTLAMINKWNSVCEWMLVDSTQWVGR